MRPTLSSLALPLLASLAAAPSGPPGGEARAVATDAAGPGERVERRLYAMGTSLEVSVEAAERAEALAASEAAVRAVEAVETRLSTWTDESELARLNATPVGRRFRPTPELAADLARVRRIWEVTSGAFDPAVGALVEAWDLRGDGRVPTEEELGRCRVPGGFGALRHGEDADGPWLLRTHSALVVEEGGFGKGIGLDAALAALREAGATSAVCDLGGQAALFGRAERFHVADPRDRSRGVVAVELAEGSFATSGNSERAIEVEDACYGHLLDPRTGSPVADFGSVTAFAPDATAADALSTGFYVLGPDAALQLAARLEGVDVLVLETDGDRLRARATRGLRDRIAPVSGELRIHWFPSPDAAASDEPERPSPQALRHR